MVMLETLKRYLGEGWVEADETWEYVSVDDPTGVFRVNADVTTKYSAGMRIKFTNGGNVIYGIITVVGAYSGGYTSITFLHEIDPTDSLAKYLLANSAITLPFYSTHKAPLGFPLQKEKWEILYGIPSTGAGNYKDGSGLAQIGSLQVDIPIGNWELSYLTNPYLTTTSGSYDYSAMSCNIGISSATDSFSSGYLQSTINLKTNSSSSVGDQRGIFSVEVSKGISISITSKTTYYLIGQAFGDNNTYVRLFANIGATGWIRAVCSYL